MGTLWDDFWNLSRPFPVDMDLFLIISDKDLNLICEGEECNHLTLVGTVPEISLPFSEYMNSGTKPSRNRFLMELTMFLRGISLIG